MYFDNIHEAEVCMGQGFGVRCTNRAAYLPALLLACQESPQTPLLHCFPLTVPLLQSLLQRRPAALLVSRPCCCPCLAGEAVLAVYLAGVACLRALWLLEHLGFVIR